MYLTEQEAREKWCPFVRHQNMAMEDGDGNVSLHVSVNRDVSQYVMANLDGADICKCIASDCMAWRWNGEVVMGHELRTHGYCGLAGRPE